MRRDHLDAVLAQLLIEWIAVVDAIADQIFRLGLDHVEVEAQLYQPNFVVIGGMRADRKRQSMTIHDCHDFHAIPALRRSDPRPATFRHHESRIDEAFRFIQGAFIAKLVGYIHQHSPQNFIAAPGLKATMNRFVVRIGLRQHVPLCAGVEYPQYSFEKHIGSGSACVQDVHRGCALPENDSGCAPTARLLAESSDIYSRSTPPSNFEIGSSYNRTYGSLGAVIAFMTWMWLSATVVLVGAAIDVETER